MCMEFQQGSVIGGMRNVYTERVEAEQAIEVDLRAQGYGTSRLATSHSR